MQYLQLLLKRSWQTIVVAVLLGLISGMCNARLIALINRAVHQPAHSQPLLPFSVLVVLTLSIGVLSQFILISLSQDAIYQLRLTLSRNILKTPLQHLEHLGDHRLLAALTDDVRVLSHTVSVFPHLCVDLATLVGCLAYLAWLSGPLFALLVTISLMGLWAIQTTIRKAQALFAIAREEEDNLFGHFQAITRGTKELKLNRHRRDDFMDNTLEASIRRMRQKNSHAMKIFAVSDGLGQLSLFLTLGVTLFIAPHFLNASLSLLATYALTITYLTMPFQNLLHGLPDLLRGNVSLRKIERMRLALAHEQEKEGAEACTVQPLCGLELHHVTYHYPPEEQEAPPAEHPHGHPEAKAERPAKGHPHRRPLVLAKAGQEAEHGFALGPISLSFQPGQITYLIGGNGSGKSTLAKLITGLYVPHSGAISLGGTQITDQNREWYRQHISAVFSDFFLFDRCLGIDRPYLDEDVRHYLRQLQLDHKVQVQDGKLSTTRLSQGQRKRLALLMAYLEDRPVYLFDEWAADQEPAFRELFYTEILVKLKQQGKTVIVITHDDRYFYLADQLIKLDYGRVASAPAPLAAARR